MIPSLLLAAGLWGFACAGCPGGCPSRCPDRLKSQSRFVQDHFALERFWGVYYELQYHDNTQPRLMSCQRSVKSPNPGGRTYKDLFVRGPCLSHRGFALDLAAR